MNNFVKPNEQSQACLYFAMARNCRRSQTFVNPNEQSQTCLHFAMARNCRRSQHFVNPNEQSQACLHFAMARNCRRSQPFVNPNEQSASLLALCHGEKLSAQPTENENEVFKIMRLFSSIYSDKKEKPTNDFHRLSPCVGMRRLERPTPTSRT